MLTSIVLLSGGVAGFILLIFLKHRLHGHW